MHGSQTMPGSTSAAILRRLARLLAMGLVIAATTSVGLSQEDAPRHHAVLIGVSEYDNVSTLQYTMEDVDGLSEILEGQGRFVVHRLRTSPTRKNILALLDDFFSGEQDALNRGFKDLKPRDRVLVFFSGHGAMVCKQGTEVRLCDRAALASAKEKAAYLCPQDFDPEQPVETGISIDWLRQRIAACEAQTKILILDSCHSGSEKSGVSKLAYARPSAGALAESFSTSAARDVVTLASCRAEESSFMSDRLRHSLFSYHVIAAFKGHADINMDGEIDVHELYAYVHERVERDARRIFGEHQRPVRIFGAGLDGIPTICRVQPMALDNLLEDMADRLAYELYSRQELPGRTVVPLEFAIHDQLAGVETLRLDSGSLGKYCSEVLRRNLKSASARLRENKEEERFQIADEKWLKQIPGGLDSQTISEPPRLTREHLQRRGALLALGTILTRVGVPSSGGTEIVLSCEVRAPDQYRPLAKAGGKARISLDESAMGGGGWLPGSLVDQRHPLQRDPKFPFPIGISVGGTIRPGKFVGNRLYIPVRKGEEYEILVDHGGRQDSIFMLRLLVDGLNTLPHHLIEAEEPVFRAAPRIVNLQDARPWVLDSQRARRFRIAGFATKVDSEGRWARFKLDDRENSLAQRQKFTDQVGVITAGIYKTNPNVPKGELASLGTTAGRIEEVKFNVREGLKVGEPVAFLSLHYIDAEAWKSLPQKAVNYMSMGGTKEANE